MPIQTDIGSLLEPALAIPPALYAAGAINGTGIDRLNTPAAAPYQYYSGMLCVIVGALAGAPTSFTVDARMQHSPDNATWTDYNPASQAGTEPTLGWVAIPTIVAAQTVARVNFNLIPAQRYLRALGSVAFVGGASPTAAVAAAVILGGADRVGTV
jgi:hypothetical protein